MELFVLFVIIGFPVIHGDSADLIYPITFSESEKAEWVDTHNHYRRKVDNPEAANMRLMTWDDGLEKLAIEVVRTCANVHTILAKRKTSVFPTAGENLYTGDFFRMSEMPTIDGVTKLWYEEVHNYTYKTRSCATSTTKKIQCGHYTQVAWANSYKVGCALAQCKKIEKGSGQYFVSCNYGPGGNVFSGGTPYPPYISGEACSQCGANDLCTDGLCNSTARDIPFTTTTTTGAPSTTKLKTTTIIENHGSPSTTELKTTKIIENHGSPSTTELNTTKIIENHGSPSTTELKTTKIMKNYDSALGPNCTLHSEVSIGLLVAIFLFWTLGIE